MNILVVESWTRPEAAAETVLRRFMERRVPLLVLCDVNEKQSVGFTVIPQMSACEIESAIRDIRELSRNL